MAQIENIHAREHLEETKANIQFEKDSLKLYNRRYREHKELCGNDRCERCELYEKLIKQTAQALEQERAEIRNILGGKNGEKETNSR